MKRQHTEHQTLVYAYGVGTILSGLDHAYAERDRNRRLWGALVGIDELNDVAILAAASADDNRLVSLRDEIYFAGRALTDAIDARARERKRVRGNTVAHGLDDAVTNWAAKHKSLRKEFYERISAWRGAHPDAIREFNARRFAAIKEARNASGLYWGNYNRVCQTFDAARQLCRKTGRRLRKSDEERTDGCLTVQIQRTSSGLGAAPRELQNGAYSALQIGAVPAAAYDPVTPRGQRSRLSQTTLDMRVDSDGHMLTARMWMHRPLPADCRIKAAQLTWRDGGARGRKWQLALTITRPPIATVHAHPADVVGIDMGWRIMQDRSLRVAIYADTHGAKELRLPAQWMEHQDWLERQQAEIDSEIIFGDDAIRKAQLRIKGGRTKDMGERREMYRLFARTIAMRYGVVAVEHLDLAAIAVSKEHAGRANRQRACVHQLLAEIKHQCAKHGAVMIPMQGPSTMQCHQCGKLGAPTDRAALFWHCDGCGTVWDQDHNAAINLMMAAAQAASGKMMGESADSKNKVLPAKPGARKHSARKSPVEISGINDAG